MGNIGILSNSWKWICLSMSETEGDWCRLSANARSKGWSWGGRDSLRDQEFVNFWGLCVDLFVNGPMKSEWTPCRCSN